MQPIDEAHANIEIDQAAAGPGFTERIDPLTPPACPIWRGHRASSA
jgi:hypothetical protein